MQTVIRTLVPLQFAPVIAVVEHTIGYRLEVVELPGVQMLRKVPETKTRVLALIILG